MELIELIKNAEGFRSKPYKDTVGKLTIGYGRNLDDVGISEVEANFLLLGDISQAHQSVLSALPWASQLSSIVFNALVEMAFNLGVAGLLEFKATLSLIEAGKYEEASKEVLLSKWASQVGARAVRISNQIKAG